MAKACWNCGEYHENGASYCPFCGASFADGQKTFMEGVVGIFDFTKEIIDPVYMQKKYLIPGVAILAAIIAIAAFVVLDNGEEEDPVISADCGYNYLAYIDSPLPTNLEGIPYKYPPEGYKFAAVKFKFLVNKPSGVVYNGVDYDWDIRLTKDDTVIEDQYTTSYAHWQPLTYFTYGEIGLQYFVFLIPGDADINDYEVTASYVNGTVEYDPDINMDD